MKHLRTRLEALERQAAATPPPGQLDLILVTSPGSLHAENCEAGVFFNDAGNCATLVVPLGAEPDPGELDKLKKRLAPHGLTIVALQEHIPPPPADHLSHA